MQILRYFVRHPEALDDLEGIARWRLLEEAIRSKVVETDRALQWLVERGFLRQTARLGSPPLFGLNPEKVDEANRLLAAGDPAGEGGA